MNTVAITIAKPVGFHLAADWNPNRITGEDSTLYLTEEDSTKIIVEED